MHRLMERVVFLGEGQAESRLGIPDAIRLAVTGATVKEALEQLDIDGSSWRHSDTRFLDPFLQRTLLPTIPQPDSSGQGSANGGLRPPQAIFPDVARGIIDPGFGDPIAPTNQDVDMSDNDIETIRIDERLEQLEAIQDEIDTLRDEELSFHLRARYGHPEPGSSAFRERPVFCERFNWTIYEARESDREVLRASMLIDEGSALERLNDRRLKTSKTLRQRFYRTNDDDSESDGDEGSDGFSNQTDEDFLESRRERSEKLDKLETGKLDDCILLLKYCANIDANSRGRFAASNIQAKTTQPVESIDTDQLAYKQEDDKGTDQTL